MSLITEMRTRLVSTATYGCLDRTPGIWIRYPISAVDPTDACLNRWRSGQMGCRKSKEECESSTLKTPLQLKAHK